MEHIWKKVISLFLAVAVAAGGFALPASAKETGPKPIIFTKTITDETTNIQVYAAKGSTLYIKNGKKTVARKKFAKESIQAIKIKPQKAGSTLKFYLSDSGIQSPSVKKTVKKLAGQKETKAIKKPVIPAKTIKSTDTKVKVKAAKGTKLYIKNDANQVVKAVKFDKDGTKPIPIPKQKDTQTLYFYLTKGNRRSAVVKKPVKDVTAPTKPSLSEKSASSLLVKGEVGSTVYIKYGTKSTYAAKGIITGKGGKLAVGLKPGKKGYYYVKLKDASGNTSAVTKLKSKYSKNPGGNSGDSENSGGGSGGTGDQEEPESPTVEYSYTVTPLLMPFNEFFYVQTQDPDPSDIRFVDKSSSYYAQGQEPAYLKPTEVRFMDVSYEEKASGRVKGGYIFSMDGSGLDGGKLTVQKKIGREYQDTKTEVSCASVKGYKEYLIDTYTTPTKSFFENLGAVQQGLDALALYPRGTKDINRKNADLPYPMLTVSPYPELTLNEWYQMYETAEEPLFLNYLYPYILDSLGFPSVMASVAKSLDPSCQVAWGAYHYMVDVTKDGETYTYGGAGSGGNDPLYSNRVEKLFLFDGSAKDYAKNPTLESLSEKRGEYGTYAREDAELYRDLIQGKTFAETIGLGSWIRVGTEGFNLLTKSYAYVTQGCVYTEGSGGIPYSVENVWVDGRYINQYNRYEAGAKFQDYPKADIMVRDMAYTNKWGNTCRGDVVYEYDEASGCWLSRAYVSYSSNTWAGDVTKEELPEEMVLTPEEVAALQVDRNTDTVPSGLVYDGTAYPGTPYGQ